MSRLTKKKFHISPGFIKTDQEAIVEVDSKVFSPTLSPLVEIETDLEGITIIEIIDPASGIDPGAVIDVTTEEIITGPMRGTLTTDRTIEGEIAIDKTIEIGRIIEEITLDKETGVRVEIGQENYRKK